MRTSAASDCSLSCVIGEAIDHVVWTAALLHQKW